MRAPFDIRGNLMHYPERSWRPSEDGQRTIFAEPEWRDVETFEVGTLTLDGLRRGRSAAYFMWRDDEGHTYPMFMKDMVDLLKRSTVQSGQAGHVLPLLWRIRKRGTNYGIGLA